MNRRLILWGAILLTIACVLLSHDKMTMNSGKQQRIITRENNPMTYWSTDVGLWVIGISLIALAFYRNRRRPTEPATLESSSTRYSLRMKIAAIVIAVFGVSNLAICLQSLQTAAPPRRSLMIFDAPLGILFLWIALGIWKRWFRALQLGFAAIALSALFSILQICFDSSKPNLEKKPIFIIAGSACSLLVSGYWSFIWYRQKKWFSHDENKPLIEQFRTDSH